MIRRIYTEDKFNEEEIFKLITDPIEIYRTRGGKPEIWKRDLKAPAITYKTDDGLSIRVGYGRVKNNTISSVAISRGYLFSLAEFIYVHSDNSEKKIENHNDGSTHNIYSSDTNEVLAGRFFQSIEEIIQQVSIISTSIKKHFAVVKSVHKGGSYEEDDLEYNVWLECPVTGNWITELGNRVGEEEVSALYRKYKDKVECKH